MKILQAQPYWTNPKRRERDDDPLRVLIEMTKKEYREFAGKSVFMPKELTAENGAKYIFMGEFFEEIQVENPEYCGCGDPDECCFCDENPDEPETIPQKVHISWTTIKEIYKLAVERLGKPITEKEKPARQFKFQYSDKLSVPFWDAVNSLQDQERGEMFLAGCLLQNMESHIIGLLNTHLKEGK